MAELNLGSVVDSITGQLVSLVSQEIGLECGVKALRRRRVTGRGKRILNEVHIFFSSSNQLIYASKMAHRVMEIRGRIDAIKSDKFDYNVSRSNNLGSFVENRPRPQTYPFDSEPYVIGRENDKKQVVQFLLNPDFEENVSILAIDILRKIKRECTSGKDLTSMNAVGSQNVLGEELHKKKYLLVLDDVWNENRYEWLKLEGLLVNSARGSKILVTARSRRVATTMTRTFHELSGLPEHDSLTLLMRMAMKHEHELRNQKLDAIAKEILKKCAGVPLAIMTIGRLLLFLSNNEEEWLNFNNNDLSRIDQKEGDIMPSLKLSYDFLPSHLKQCFAYCSLFPKDYELDPLELIYLWMAQGFIRPLDNKKTVEEVGYDYFMELLSRSFFQDIQEDHYGNIVRCKMHDLMHDLAESVAGDICITIDSSHAKSFPKGARHVSITFDLDEIKGFERDQRIRSLFLMVEKRILIAHLEVSYFRNLRALRIRAVNIKAISKSISKLKHLRSLDLSENKELTSLPNSISRLCNLEILNLSSCHKLKGLPRGITKLVNLRQLDLIDCYALTHMPRGIGKLTSLQMLNVFVVGKKSNRNAARLNELSRLAGILLRNKGLIIEGLENVESISSEVDASFSMEKLAIQKLGLHWCPDEVRANAEEVLQRLRPHRDIRGLDILGYDGVRLPSWLSQLHDLVEIRIFVCQQCNHLPPLDHLPFLKKICLDSLDNLECVELSESSGTLQSFYPSLKEIELYNLDKFKGWERRSRRDNRIEQEEDIREEEEEDHSSSYMLCKFVDNVKIDIDSCPKFSYMQGEQLHVSVTTIKLLEQLLRNAADHSDPQPGHHPTNLPSLAVPNPSTSKMTFISITSIPVSALTSLAIDSMNDADHLPMELFQSVPSLKSLAISMHQLQGGHKLRQITITEVHKTRSLPGWFQYLPNLQELTIETCFGLKSLPRRLFLPLLTTLESLSLCDCPELDLSRTGESGDQQDMSNLQFAKLRDLSFWGEKMETLPWWIQHLTNLESLSIRRCTDLKAMPEWFPQLTSLQYLEVYGCEKELTRRCKRKTGEDWPKISHIPRLYVV
ncbi:hypothetical protein CRG98_026355 [Punica granatum]|uniref:Uncharacterized protein n=1 Tax=Punica granatum TaxID=22663 RepID=A0A2I0JB32_PUNGR|nr:hypothetical protein CRG98_026355 [Punica granatum]